MGKQNKKGAAAPTPAVHSQETLADLQQKKDLWYRIKVLLYDLSNVASDPASEKRSSSTTNELYISAPYFTDSEAHLIRSALVGQREEQTPSEAPVEITHKTAISDAIQQKLRDFFDKRRASGDARPCGPHDMVPIYASVFGLDKSELRDGKFLGRVRRSGLGDFESRLLGEDPVQMRKKGKKAK